MAFIPSLSTAIGAASPQEGGLASGLVNTSYQVGSAVGLAAATAVMSSAVGAGTGAEALTDSYSAGLLLAAAIAGIGAVVTAVALRGAPAAAAAPEEYVLAQ